MAGFASYDDLINEMTVNGKSRTWRFSKLGTGPEQAGQMHTFWKASGMPGAGSNPASTPGVAYDSDDGSPVAGSMYFADATGGDTKHLISISATATVGCTLLLIDRLTGVGSVDTATTGNKTINSAALTRYTDGIGVQPYLELTTASTTAATLSVNSYTDTDNNTGQAGPTITFPQAAQNVDSMWLLPLAAGDVGCKAISTINVATAGSGSVATVGLCRVVAELGLIANISNSMDFVLNLPSLPRIYDNACLMLAMIATTTTAVTVHGQITVAWG